MLPGSCSAPWEGDLEEGAAAFGLSQPQAAAVELGEARDPEAESAARQPAGVFEADEALDDPLTLSDGLIRS